MIKKVNHQSILNKINIIILKKNLKLKILKPIYLLSDEKNYSIAYVIN